MTYSSDRSKIVIRPKEKSRWIDIKELYNFRGLLLRMARRHVASEFSELSLGIFWAVARPILMTLIFVFIHNLSNANTGVSVPYPAYLYSGLALWFFFVEGTSRAAGSIGIDAAIMQKIYFPRLLSPLAIVIAQMVTLGVNMIPMAIIMIITGSGPDWHLVFFPIVVLQVFLLCLGVGCLVAALSAFNKDWIRLLKLMLYIGLFTSPVIYSLAMLSMKMQMLFYVNPMAGALLTFRATLLSGFAMPTAMWIYSLLLTFFIFILGVWAFLKTERSFLDKI